MINNYHRLEGESDEELIYRITGDKQIIGSWQDVADILNDLLGTEYTESKFRKQRQAFDKLFAAYQNKYISDKQIFNSLDEKKRELEKERKKLQTEKIEYNRWLRENARDELIVDKIVDAVNALEPLIVPEQRVVSENTTKEGILVISDCHYGVEFEIKGLFGEILNAYSPEIFEERMWKLFRKVCEIVQKENLDTIHIISCGDELEGLLRLTSQLMKLRYGVVESTVKFANFFAAWLNLLSTKVNIKVHFVMDSNHNQLRLCGAPKNAFKDENMAVIIKEIVKVRLTDNPNVEIVDNPTGYPFILVCDQYNVLAIHGEVKNLGKAIDDFGRSYGVPIDYIIGGHKHHRENVETGIDCEAISVGSVIGVDSYGLSLNKTSNASATFLVFEGGLGKSVQYDIKLN